MSYASTATVCAVHCVRARLCFILWGEKNATNRRSGVLIWFVNRILNMYFSFIRLQRVINEWALFIERNFNMNINAPSNGYFILVFYCAGLCRFMPDQRSSSGYVYIWLDLLGHFNFDYCKIFNGNVFINGVMHSIMFASTVEVHCECVFVYFTRQFDKLNTTLLNRFHQ